MPRDLRFKNIWLIGGWVAVIAALVVCLVPGKYVEVPNLNDKVEHATGFVLLVLWFCGIYSRRRYWVIALSFLVFGALIEVLQGAMNWGRHADILDWCADSAGVIAGILLSLTPLQNWPRWIEAIFSRKFVNK
jgi:VanZ family protein